MSYTQSWHTKLAQYVIQSKNTAHSRYFTPRMRVSKGIKDSKAALHAANKTAPLHLTLSISFTNYYDFYPHLFLSIFLHAKTYGTHEEYVREGRIHKTYQ